MSEADAPPAPLALTMGEPAGIGAEISLIAWRARADREVPPFVLIADPRHLAAVGKTLGLTVPIREVATPAEAAEVFETALPVLPVPLATPATLGKPDPANAAAVLQAIEQAVALAGRGAVSAVVTNPIQKQVLYSAGFRHPGHTEYLAELAGSHEAPVMMLACPALRVIPVTIHLPLRRAIETLDSAMIVHAGRTAAEALRRDFAIARPRLAVTGLNPHAGEGGALGSEEAEIIEPAIATLRGDGLAVQGPVAADSLFHAEARASYDVALCMYHDQALIPIKTLDFAHGVNVTLGLPFVRTSPDHGTALGIAGRGIANATSLISALHLARAMAASRARTGAAANAGV